MKIKNNSSFPKVVSGTRLGSGETTELEGVSEKDLPTHVEILEKSGDSGSDQNTKTDSNPESEKEEKGGEN